MIKTFEQLAEKQQSCSACMAAKFSGESGKRAVVLCGGTGCLSSNSAEIRERFQKVIDEKVFKGMASVELKPDPEDVKGFNAYIEKFARAFPAERAAVETV